MPVVFVHGVNTRRGASYTAQTLAIEKFFQRHLTGATVGGKRLAEINKVEFPYWGDLATKFAWNMAALPKSGVQALGASSVSLQPILALVRDALPQAPTSDPLTALAKKDLRLSVQAIIDLAMQAATQQDAAAVAEFVVLTSAYAEANPHADWLETVNTDDQLITTLFAKLVKQQGDVQTLGGFGSLCSRIKLEVAKLKGAAQDIAAAAGNRLGDFASTKLLASTRAGLNETLGRFFGDVFIYFEARGQQGNPGAVGSLILKAFDDARAAPPGELFIIVAHSFGGVITFDLLSHFRTDIEPDLLVTVGSQVGHFEEMKLYKSSDKGIGPPSKAKTPPNVKRWINIYDEVDIFAYAVSDIFDRIDVDAPYDTATYAIKAHGAYFEQDRFYQSLRARIDQLS